MARRPWTAIDAVLIAALVAAVAGGNALATAPVDEPTGGLGGQCPRDIAAAEAAAATTTPATAAAAPESSAPAAPDTTAAAVETTAPAPIETAPPATLPESTISINRQPRDALRQGGSLRLEVLELPENWNPLHPDGDNLDYFKIRQPMGYFPFLIDNEGVATPNPDFVLGMTVSEDNRTVTYQLNPAAVWHSGDPITAADWHAAWNALNGLDPEFQAVTTDGYDLITSVEQGADEFEVVVTFCQPYPDFETLFWEIAPAEMVADPETFNTGWVGSINNDWFTGPFEVGTIVEGDYIELVPSDTWWGATPLLDTIQFEVARPDGTAQAFANHEIDSFDIGVDPNDYAMAAGTPGGEVRAAAARNFNQITLNSGPKGGLIQDRVVRQAIQMALDRATIGESGLAGIPWPAQPLNNHIFLENSPFYVDNAGQWGTYDPEAAMALLEDNGWVLGDDGVREKDGRPLTIRFSQLVGTPWSESTALLVQAQLAEAGIEVDIVDVVLEDFADVLTEGYFETLAFGWIGSAFPFRGVEELYGNGSESNFAFSNIPELDPLLDQLAVAFDDTERAAIANEIDVVLWEYGHSIPLYQRPELVAVPADLANYGAFGLMNPPIWTDVGYL